MSARLTSGGRIEQLNQAARDGDINGIYSIIKLDADILEDIDAIPFVDTPLHKAALGGRLDHIRFAMEMMRLKLSFSRKPNPDGLCPIHVALQGGHAKMVYRFLQVDADLVRVKGKEGRTPLHVVAEKSEQLDLLVKFLSCCPNSIEDVTIQNQTAMHIALESNNMLAFECLVSSLRKFDSEKAREILNQLDDNEMCVLKLAVSKRNTKAVKLLLDFGVNFKNVGQEEVDDLEIKYRINCDEHLSCSCTILPNVNCYEYCLRNPIKCIFQRSQILKKTGLFLERFFVKLRLLRQTACERSIVSNDDRNVLLVVAALLITITHQSATNPPGGVWSENQAFGSNPPAAAPAAVPAAGVEFYAGTSIGQSNFPNFGLIATINYIIFTLSTIMTFVLLPGGYIGALFKMALVQLWVSYYYSLTVIIQSMPVFLFSLISTGLCLLLVVIAFFGRQFCGATVKRLRLDWIFYMVYACIMFLISVVFVRGFYSEI